jgi:hypothetical protein
MPERRSVPTLRIPDFEKMTLETGLITENWRDFFRVVKETLDPLGVEKAFTIENNQVTEADITGLKFNSSNVSLAIFEYLIKRVTTGTNPVELLQAGTLHFVYRPTDEDWDIITVGTPGPDSSGVVLTITPEGQVQYISSLVDGTASISKIFYRVRTISGKTAG